MQQPIRFLADENIRADVVDYLRQQGHTVYLSREELAISAPDQLLALLVKHHSLVVVTHDRHFKKFREMLPEHERSRMSKGAGRLQLEVRPEISLRRISEELENIEHHYYQALKKNIPFLMVIQDANIRVTTK